MREQNTGIVATLWLHMLSEGGYSTIGELLVAAGDKATKKRIDGLMSQLVTRGFAHKVPNPERKNGACYGVTASCKVPNNVQLKDILAAIGPE